MRDIMIDIETLGTTAGSVILSIGAVAFDPDAGVLGARHYGVVSIASSLSHGATVDEATLHWWSQRTAAAQGVLFAALSPAAPGLSDELARLSDFLLAQGSPADLRIWGNGSDFDNVLLVAAYAQAGRKQPWRFYNHRCFRTFKNLFPGFEPVREGEHHNALDDAVHQARHALAIEASRALMRRAA